MVSIYVEKYKIYMMLAAFVTSYVAPYSPYPQISEYIALNFIYKRVDI
jgi:hypothetical protein